MRPRKTSGVKEMMAPMVTPAIQIITTLKGGAADLVNADMNEESANPLSLQTRQQLATLEERNRLARDLHDSVKQQVFAVSMQLAATRILLKRDVDAAGDRLNKAE